VLFAKNFGHEINCVPRADFFQQIGPVEFDGARTNPERARDLLVGETPDDLSQHHPLPRSQSRVAREWIRQRVQRTCRLSNGIAGSGRGLLGCSLVNSLPT
jgi:hypothetical protein